MLHAAQLKDRSATIEHARLLWKDGHHRKAIQILEGSIAANESMAPASSLVDRSSMPSEASRVQRHDTLAARVSSLPEMPFFFFFLPKQVLIMFIGTPAASEMD